MKWTYCLVLSLLFSSCISRDLEYHIRKEKEKRNKEGVVVQEQKTKVKTFSIKPKYNNRNKKIKG